ncbi:26S proteasome subunit RPN7-domain-containing protein [Emericellopsis atlantica]|uniref:26S proteasome subunit RPN7-domain-containing protein n=1 Tax=Emericellopsis atlantica TaxID=2614577 RepID=A0A9P7ZJ03_9HYPO|nr:26S proteasome subunit RPN7-domain-containing protein [Emericellopsis atlantica]KAG9252806.1 26S proteasome subunit RPN7-domain-containing protein [Emericellopsis atlantica]
MAHLTPDLQNYFGHMRQQGGVVVESEKPPGRTQFDRLLHIGRSSIPLCVDALKAAVKEAKAGGDVSRYNEAWENIRVAAPYEPEAIKDEEWIKRQNDINKKESTRLESNLSGYKQNGIKESIRMGNEDLGQHYEQIGKLREASDAYGRMRHEVSTTKHIMDCCQRLISVALQRRDWSSIISNIAKINSIQGVEDDRGMQPYIKIVSGIGYLGKGLFKEAADNLLQADLSAPADTFNDIATPNDVAIYGGLLALAVMDRDRLQTRVLDNPQFRVFLETESHIRKAITHFVSGRYSACLSILESYKADYLLDIYLSKHVETIFSRIRQKCITQYFVPFSCVTLDSLNETFAHDGQSIEAELVDMIRSGSLNARIDSESRLLVAVQSDPRLEMQYAALKAARKYGDEAKERLRRINLIAAGLEVKAGKQQPGGEIAWAEGAPLGAVS